MAVKKKLKPLSHHGLGNFIRTWFERSKPEKEIRLEPKDWPEVRDFIMRLNQLIESNTITDHNIQRLNQRIVDRIENQINQKGQLQDIEQRFSALDSIADSFLSSALNRIVGFTVPQNENGAFSKIVLHFKDRLHQRYQQELALKQKASPLRPN